LNYLCGSIQRHIDNPPRVRAKTFRNWIGDLWNKFVWNPIIYPLTHKFFSYNTAGKYFGWMRYNTRYVPVPVPQVVAAQVKEKFGGLRFYCEGGDSIIRGMVTLAESLSYKICENCGVMNETVHPSEGGWVKTTCNLCGGKAYKENRNTELEEIWEKVREDKRRENDEGNS
jgi:hypothetical protein